MYANYFILKAALIAFLIVTNRYGRELKHFLIKM